MFVVLIRYMAMVKTGPNVTFHYRLLLGKFVVAVCCAEVLFQPSFFHVESRRVFQSCVTERTTEPNTAQTERVLTRLVEPMTPHSSKKSASTPSVY